MMGSVAWQEETGEMSLCPLHEDSQRQPSGTLPRPKSARHLDRDRPALRSQGAVNVCCYSPQSAGAVLVPELTDTPLNP